MQIPNTESNSRYLQLCKAAGVAPHPARFPQKLPAFFIDFLTEPGDTVLDIFASSNTTGTAAEACQRRWIAFEQSLEYLATSAFRFLDPAESSTQAIALFKELIETQKTIQITCPK
ncbi:DNA methyltransferase [Phormidesmis sp. 146-33]